MIVYTAVIGNTDPLHEPEVVGDCRYLCLTDQPLKSRHWEIIRVQPGRQPTRLARSLKIRSMELFGDEPTLWIDACFTLTCDPTTIAATQDIMATQHFQRSRITEEAEAIIQLGKARESDIRRQLASYRKGGFDTDGNPQQVLTYTGILYRKPSARVRMFEQVWFDQIQEFSLRDQMSVDYSAWLSGAEIGYWPGTHRNNRIARYNHYKRPVNDY